MGISFLTRITTDDYVSSWHNKSFYHVDIWVEWFKYKEEYGRLHVEHQELEEDEESERNNDFS